MTSQTQEALKALLLKSLQPGSDLHTVLMTSGSLKTPTQQVSSQRATPEQSANMLLLTHEHDEDLGGWATI